MPKMTQGNAKDYLYATVKRYVQITKDQAGIILTNNGDISVIGSEPFKEFVNDHRKEIHRVMLRSTSSSSTDVDLIDSSISRLHDTEISSVLTVTDLSSYSIDRLRHLRTSALRKSLGELINISLY